MDYIIVGLWALLCGGLIWSGSSSSKTQSLSAIQSEPLQIEASPLIEMPNVDAMKPKKIAAQAQPYLVEPPVQNETQATAHAVADPYEVIPVQPANNNLTRSVASTDEPQALSFKKSKKHKKAKEAKPKRSMFDKKVTTRMTAPVVPAGNTQQRDTVIVFRVTSDENVVLAEVPASEMAENLTITDPLFAPESSVKTETTAPVSLKQQGLRLPGQMKVEQLLCDESGYPIRHMLKRGESLTQIAQQYYHDASFWPYVFFVNRYQLKSPDRIQADMKLYLPDPNYYGIDGNNPESVAKAKEEAHRLK